MNKKKFARLAVLILLILSNLLIFKYCNLQSKSMTLSYNLTSDKVDTYQVFYGINNVWNEEQSQKIIYNDIGKEKKLKFQIPKESKVVRLDLGSQNAEIQVRNLKLSSYNKSIEIDINEFYNENRQNQVLNMENIDSGFKANLDGEDPYLIYNLDQSIVASLNESFDKINNILKVVICLVVDMLGLTILKKSRNFIWMFVELKNNKQLIWNLAKNDFKTKYAGSYLGITWAFIQPIVTIVVYWFVFEFGLKAGSPIENVPFVVWFVSGIIPWFFFQEALLNATNCMLEYSYLVKKVVFKIGILPIVKIISALFVHLVFIGFLFFVAEIYGFYPSKYSIQLVYYSFCTFSITLAVSYATSAIVIFFKDLGQIINIFLQIGMWMTPIMWSYTIIPENLQWIVKLNPMYYIVEGYRDTFINKVWFVDRYFQTVYFWVVTLGIFALSVVIFKKLKPHFADVL